MDGTVYPNTFNKIQYTTATLSNVIIPPYFVQPVVSNANTTITFDSVVVTLSHPAENIQWLVQPDVYSLQSIRYVGFGGLPGDQGDFDGLAPPKGWSGREPYQFTPCANLTPSDYSAPLQFGVSNGVYGVHITYDFGVPTTIRSCFFVVPTQLVQITVYSPRYTFFFTSNTGTDWTLVHAETYNYPFSDGYGFEGGYGKGTHDYVFSQDHTGRYWRAVIAECGTGYLFLHSVQFRGDYSLPQCISVSTTESYSQAYGLIITPDTILPGKWYLESNTYFVNTTQLVDSNAMMVSIEVSIDAPEIIPTNGTIYTNGPMAIDVFTKDFYQTEYYAPTQNLSVYTPLLYSQLELYNGITVTTSYPNVLSALFTNNFNTRVPRPIPATTNVYTHLSNLSATYYGHYIECMCPAPLSNISIGVFTPPEPNTVVIVQSTNSIDWSRVVEDNTPWTVYVKTFSFSSSSTRYRIIFQNAIDLTLLQYDGYPTTPVSSNSSYVSSLSTDEYTITLENMNRCDIPKLTQVTAATMTTQMFTPLDVYYTFTQPTVLTTLDIYANSLVETYTSHQYSLSLIPTPVPAGIPLVPGVVKIYGSNTSTFTSPLFSGVLIEKNSTFTINGTYKLYTATFASNAFTYWKVHIDPPYIIPPLINPFTGEQIEGVLAEEFNISSIRLYRPFVYTNSNTVSIRARINSDSTSLIQIPKNTPVKMKLGRLDSFISFTVDGFEYLQNRVLTTSDIPRLAQATIGPFIGQLISYTPYEQYTTFNDIWNVYNDNPQLTYTFYAERYITRETTPRLTGNVVSPNGFSFISTYAPQFDTVRRPFDVAFEIRSADFLTNSYGNSLVLRRTVGIGPLDFFNLIYFSNGYTISYPIQVYQLIPGYSYTFRGTVTPSAISIQLNDESVSLYYLDTSLTGALYTTRADLLPLIPIQDIDPIRYRTNPETITVDLKRYLDVQALSVDYSTTANNATISYTSGLSRRIDYTVERIVPDSIDEVYWIYSSNICGQAPNYLEPEPNVISVVGFSPTSFSYVTRSAGEGIPSDLVLPETRVPSDLTVQRLNWTLSTPILNTYTFTDVYSYTPGLTYYRYTTVFLSAITRSFTNMTSNTAHYGTFSGDGTVYYTLDLACSIPSTVQSTFTLSLDTLYLADDLVTLSETPTFFYRTVRGTYCAYPFTTEISTLPDGYTVTYEPVLHYVNAYDTYVKWSNGSYYSFATGLYQTDIGQFDVYPSRVKRGVMMGTVYNYSIYSLTSLTEPFTLSTSGGYVYYNETDDTFQTVRSAYVATLFRLSDTGQFSTAITRQLIGLLGTKICIRDATYFPSWKILRDGRITFNVFPGYQNCFTIAETFGDISITPTMIDTGAPVASFGTHIRYNDRVVEILSRSGNTYTIRNGTYASVSSIAICSLENIYFSMFYVSRGFVIGNDPLYFTQGGDTSFEYSLQTTCTPLNNQFRQKITYDMYDSRDQLWRTNTVDVFQPISSSWIYIALEPQNVSDITFYGTYNIDTYTSSNTSIDFRTNRIQLTVTGTTPTFVPSATSVFDMATYTVRYISQWESTYELDGQMVYVFPVPVLFNEIKGVTTVKASNDPSFIIFYILDLPYTKTPFRYYMVPTTSAPQFIRSEERTSNTPWAPFTVHQSILTDNCLADDFPYTSRIVFRGYTYSTNVVATQSVFTRDTFSNGLSPFTLTVFGDDIYTFKASNLVSFVPNAQGGLALSFTRYQQFIGTGTTTTPLPFSGTVYTGYIVEDAISTVQKNIYVYTTNTLSYIETSDFPDVAAFTNVQQVSANVVCTYPLSLAPNTLAISRGSVDVPDMVEISNGSKVYIQNNTFVRTTYTGGDISIGLANLAYLPGTPVTLPQFTSNTADAPYSITLKDDI